MASGESAKDNTNGVQFRDPKPTRAEVRDSQRNTARDSNARGSRISQGSQSGKGGVLMIRKFAMTDELKNYTVKEAFYVSIVQIVIGILCFILGIVAVVVKTAGYESGVGIWGGAIIIATGVVGVLAYKRRIARLVVSVFALALISLVIGGTMLIMLAVFLTADVRSKEYYTESISFWPEGSAKAIAFQELADGMPPKIAIDAILMVLGIVEIIVAVIQAVIVGKVLIIRGPKRRSGEAAGVAGTPMMDMMADDGWGEYNPTPKPPLTRTISETEAEAEWQVDPSRAPTKRSSYRGSKTGGYSPVKKQPPADIDSSGGARASGGIEVGASADVDITTPADIEIGISAGASVDADTSVKY